MANAKLKRVMKRAGKLRSGGMSAKQAMKKAWSEEGSSGSKSTTTKKETTSRKSTKKATEKTGGRKEASLATKAVKAIKKAFTF